VDRASNVEVEPIGCLIPLNAGLINPTDQRFNQQENEEILGDCGLSKSGSGIEESVIVNRNNSRKNKIKNIK